MNDIQNEIMKLKRKKNAVILAHNYQKHEIIEISDYIGDSFELSNKAMYIDAERIVFCGVEFMAESAKLLNPDKKVLLPTKKAGCFMANRINAEDIRDLKKKHPKAKIVAYVNTTAEVKSEVDICCTSANAIQIVNSLDTNEIIFIPDRHLAEYVQSKVDKKIIPWEKGFCFLHTNINQQKIQMMKEKYPKAEILMHPEVPILLHQFADYIYGTGGMIKHIKSSCANTFLIATEEHMSSTLKYLFPEKEFIPLMHHCTYMGQITLENTLEALKFDQYEITIPSVIAKKARIAMERMIDVTMK